MLACLIIGPFFGHRRTQFNGIISSQYPALPLPSFGCPLSTVQKWSQMVIWSQQNAIYLWRKKPFLDGHWQKEYKYLGVKF